MAASLLDEMLSGARALAAAQGTEEVAPNEFWQYRIEVDPAPHDELAVLRVVVSQDLPEQLEPASFTLLRWIPNPSTAATSGDEASSSSSSFDDGVRSE